MSSDKAVPWQFVRMMSAAFLCYLGMVMPMSSITVQVTGAWGLSNFQAGLATGAAFFITMAFRKPAGDLADRRGGKYCFLRGSLCYVLGGLVCMVSAWSVLPIPARYAALLAGRLAIGVGESLTNVGMAHWTVGIIGMASAGRIFATIGMCMYAAVAFSGKIGFDVLYLRHGFAALLAACTAAPLLGYLVVHGCRDGGCSEVSEEKTSLPTVIKRIWRVALPASFHAVAFPVLGAFLAKTFSDRGWPQAGLGLTFWGVGYVVMRLFIGHLPDKIGGLPVAAISATAQLAGLYLLWLAPGPYWAWAGSFLTGAGSSMIFPSLCLETVKLLPARLRGSAISCYNMFMDVSYACAAPIAGLFTDHLGNSFAYLFAALAATAGLLMIVRMHLARRRRGGGE